MAKAGELLRETLEAMKVLRNGQDGGASPEELSASNYWRTPCISMWWISSYWRPEFCPRRVTEIEALMSNTPKILPPDHQCYTAAVEAMRLYHEALDTGAPASEVERLRLIAESLFQAVTDYQMRAFGRGRGTIH